MDLSRIITTSLKSYHSHQSNQKNPKKQEESWRESNTPDLSPTESSSSSDSKSIK